MGDGDKREKWMLLREGGRSFTGKPLGLNRKCEGPVRTCGFEGPGSVQEEPTRAERMLSWRDLGPTVNGGDVLPQEGGKLRPKP